MTGKKNLFMAAAAVSLCVALGGLSYYLYAASSIHQAKLRELKTIAELKVDQLTQWYNEKIGDADAVSGSPYFRRGAESWLRRSSDASLRKELREALVLYRSAFGIQDIALTSPEGALLFSIDTSLAGLEPMTAGTVRAQSRQPRAHAIACYYCAAHDRVHYDIVTPVRDMQGRIIASLIFRADPSVFIYPLLKTMPTSVQTAETQFVHREGDSVLILSDTRLAGAQNTPAIPRRPLTATSLLPVKAVLGYRGSFEGSDSRGREVLAYILPIPTTSWSLIVKVDHAEITPELWSKGIVTGAITAILILLVMAGSAFIYRSRQKMIYEELFIKEKDLRESEMKYRGLVENSPDAIAMYVDGRVAFANSQCVRMIGANSPEELIGRPVMDFVHPENRPLVLERMKAMAAEGKPLPPVKEKFRRFDGTSIDVEVNAIPSVYEHKPGVLVIVRDITDRLRLEQQLMHAQKLEGIGTLAGGIAHDFNNLLAMIMGSAELLQRRIETLPEMKKYVDRIITASERGSSISRQLLLFSRPDQGRLEPISLSQTISELQDMLRHFLPKTIEIEREIATECDTIMGDRGQIHQALLNLAINAGDAMAHQGTLRIREFCAAPELVRTRFAAAQDVQYVAVSVADTGVGIDEKMLGKIFDPFFSTKERGKGTGLGLAMVHGIVKHHNGFIDVVSAPGAGATFTIYFPALTAGQPART